MRPWSQIRKKELNYINHVRKKTNVLRARIYGFLAGDGNIQIGNMTTNFHHMVRFFPDHNSLIKPYVKAFRKVFGKNPKIIKEQKHFCLLVDSKTVVLDIIKTGKFGLYKWRVPFSLLKDRTSKIEWLRAFFDSEAYVHKKYLRIQSVNKQGILDVKKLLKGFDINTSFYTYKPKNRRWNRNYILCIIKKNEITKYAKLISFNHTAKFKKLNKQISRYATIA